MAGASNDREQPVHEQHVIDWLAKVFTVEGGATNWPRAVAFLDLALVLLVVFWAIGYEQYLLSALFGLLFSGLADPGGSFRHRALGVGIFALVGAALTALAFGIGASAWEWSVLATVVVTFAAGLAVAFGVRRFVTALLLNIWFIIALGAAIAFHQAGSVRSETWAQVLAWAGGSALWILLAFLGWLIRGRHDQPRPVPELPGDTSRQELTPPKIAFAAIRAVALGGTVALAFGLRLPHGLWIPVATIVAMKPSLEQSTVIAAQRVTGALIGGAAAALLLLVPANEHGAMLMAAERGLEVVALVLLMHGVAIRFWSYTMYCAAIAAGVLVLLGLPQPSDYSTEGYRVLWTLCGVGVGVLVMLLAGLLARISAGRATRQAAPQPT